MFSKILHRLGTGSAQTPLGAGMGLDLRHQGEGRILGKEPLQGCRGQGKAWGQGRGCPEEGAPRASASLAVSTHPRWSRSRALSLHLPLLSPSTSLSHFLKIWQVSLAPPLRIIPYNISQGR